MSYIWYNNESASEVTLITSLNHLHSFSTKDDFKAGRGVEREGEGGRGRKKGRRGEYQILYLVTYTHKYKDKL